MDYIDVIQTYHHIAFVPNPRLAAVLVLGIDGGGRGLSQEGCPKLLIYYRIGEE